MAKKADLHDVIRKAMLAQGKVDPDAVIEEAASLDLEEPTKYEIAHVKVVDTATGEEVSDVYVAEQIALGTMCATCDGRRQVWNERMGDYLRCPDCSAGGSLAKLHRPEEEAVPQPITWEEFFTPDECATTKRVRRGQQRLGPLARSWVASRVGGGIGDGSRSEKQFVNTSRGRYRISLSADGDNTTEQVAHERMGVETVAIEDMEEMVEFFELHHVPGRQAYEELREYLRVNL